MEFRKIKLKCKRSDLETIVKNLITKEDTEGELNPVIEQTLNILDSSENYKTLGKLKEVIDWEFEELAKTKEELEEAENFIDSRDLNYSTHPIYDMYSYQTPSVYDCRSELVAVWMMYYNKPNIIPGTELWESNINNLLNSPQKSAFMSMVMVVNKEGRVKEIYESGYFYFDFETLIKEIYSEKRKDRYKFEEFLDKVYEILKR